MLECRTCCRSCTGFCDNSLRSQHVFLPSSQPAYVYDWLNEINGLFSIASHHTTPRPTILLLPLWLPVNLCIFRNYQPSLLFLQDTSIGWLCNFRTGLTTQQKLTIWRGFSVDFDGRVCIAECNIFCLVNIRRGNICTHFHLFSRICLSAVWFFTLYLFYVVVDHFTSIIYIQY